MDLEGKRREAEYAPDGLVVLDETQRVWPEQLVAVLGPRQSARGSYGTRGSYSTRAYA